MVSFYLSILFFIISFYNIFYIHDKTNHFTKPVILHTEEKKTKTGEHYQEILLGIEESLQSYIDDGKEFSLSFLAFRAKGTTHMLME